MKAYKISNNIYWVGAVDYNVRSFHGYNTDRGSTYNAYLIIDEKITLVDTVKAAFSAEMIARINSVIDISTIDYIVCNHSEFDHSGAIPDVLALAPKAKVVSSMFGNKFLANIYGQMPSITIKSGETLSIGANTLKFISTPMVHWPDNMVTYLVEEQLLLSNDAFGQHLATNQRLDTEIDNSILMYEAKKYYANIVLPYNTATKKAIEALKDTPIKIIAPSHGVIWTKEIPQIMALYNKFTSIEKDETAVIVYDTMWGNTEKVAKALGAKLETQFKKVSYFNLQFNELASIMTEVSTCSVLAVGSPTLNNNIMPNVAAFLCYLRGLAPEKLKFIAFGTFGWAGGSTKQITEQLSTFAEAYSEPIAVNLCPSTDALAGIEK